MTREYKGKKINYLPQSFVVIDIETTGLDCTLDEIIEVSAIKVIDGKKTDSFTSLIKPSFEIPDFIEKLTGITNEMLLSAPSINEIIPKFYAFIENSILVGHNVTFDINFLYDNIYRLTGKYVSNDYLDTMRMSRRLFPFLQNHKLETISFLFKTNNSPAHRSLLDCEATLDCYNYMEKYIFDLGIDVGKLFTPKHNKLKAIDVVSQNETYDTTHPFFGKVCVFTGALSIPRQQAMQLIANVGGINGDNVTKQTNYLVMGNNDYCPTIKEGKSTKQKKAEALILDGQDLQIITETTFFEMLNAD